MSIWSNATISRFAQEAENEIASEVHCIIVRLSLQIQSFVPAYSIPSDCLSLRRVTWKGKKLDALGTRPIDEYRVTNPNFIFGAFDSAAFTSAFYINSTSVGTPAGTPYAYWFSSFGENVISLLPIPNSAIAFNSGDLFLGDVIQNSFVVEYWAYPDFNSSTQRIPAWIRRRIIKSYVLYKCMSQEGPGYDEVGSKFYKSLYEMQLQRLRQVNERIFYSKPQNLGDERSRFILARPILKYKYIGF